MPGETPGRIALLRRIRVPKSFWRIVSFVAAALVLYLFVSRWNRWQGDERWQTTDDAYLQADLTPLSAQVPGYVQDVPVQDYASVKAGQMIVQIDDSDYRARVEQAQADVAAAEAQIEQVQAQFPLQEANLRAAQANADATAAQLLQSGRDVARARRLLTTGSSSTEEVEKAETARQQLSAQLAANRAQADVVSRQINLLHAQLDAVKAALLAKQAALKLARINLGYTRITAPEAGMIGLRQVFAGQFIAAGTQVTTLSRLPHVYVLANYKETQLTHVRIGQKATVTVDSFPGATLRGHVVAISPASGAQLALLPPDNATGNFTKIVQRISVKIDIDDPAGLASLLRAGMSVEPSIDTSSGPHS
ncbi:MAG TPA: HlyD family secretion protein [Acidocella sp.]|uniref:HlyD family secretion protein n=1 Tax=Acidocella sp. TaxID=50710 RepID=UPI002C2D48C8|nr:HlyD family secretion protein [Acidocella sp.]HVE23161.1 HlyD family secretion protein [Acidocella sp.]